MLDQLLDEERISGQWAIWRDVGPNLQVHLVDRTDIGDAQKAIAERMQVWGGTSTLLLPVDRDKPVVEPEWRSLFRSAAVDEVVTRGLIPRPDWRDTMEGVSLSEYSGDELLWPMLIAQHEKEQSWTVDLGLPDVENDWFISYLAAFGQLDEDIDEDVLSRSGLRPDAELSDLLEIRHDPVLDPCAENLVARIRDFSAVSPRTLTLVGLSSVSAGWSQDLATSPTWTQEGWARKHIGSNVAIVYEPGSVPDLCLAWNLRASHGFPPGMPLAIPNTESVVADLSLWSDPDSDEFAGRLRGFGRPFALTSLSVPTTELERIAGEAGPLWKATPAVDLVQRGFRPFRRTTDVATFEDGQATIAGLDSDSSDLIQRRPKAAFGPNLRVRITVQEKVVPNLQKLRNDFAFDPGWRDGGFELAAPKVGDSVHPQFPHGWAVLRAACLQHGLTIKPSKPGSAGVALMRRIGGPSDLNPLRDQWLLSRLDQLAERKGISWFRKRTREMASKLDPENEDGLGRIEDYLDQLVVVGDRDELADLTVSELATDWGIERARSWVEWAERRGLIIRGVNVVCPTCNARAWRTISEISPPIICGGCGRSLDHPFPADTLAFRYRASQSLLEVMASDALPHLLCAGWWAALLRGGLYGFHPGVEFYEEGKLVGEADVVLMLADGGIAVGECKRRGVGLKQGDVDRLETIADRLNALFTFYATPDWSDGLPSIWTDLRRDLPDRRRFALSGEHLLRNSYTVFSQLGADATQPNAQEGSDPATLEDEFKDYLSRVVVGSEKPEGFDDYVLNQSGLKEESPEGDGAT